MALEDLTGSNKFITALVAANPLSADDRREGDDHLRGIKNVLRNTFPLLDGQVNFNAADMSAGITGGKSFSAGAYLPLTGGTLDGGANTVLAQKSTTYSALKLWTTGAPVDKRRWSLALPSDGNVSLIGTNDAENVTYASLAYVQSAGQWSHSAPSGFNFTVQDGGGSARTLGIFDSGAQGAGLRLEATGATGGVKTLRVRRSDGALTVVNAAFTQDVIEIANTGRLDTTFGFGCRSGQAGARGASVFNFFWTGTALQGWVDSSSLGTVNFTSDERIKKSIEPLYIDNDKFLQIEAISFRFANVGIYKDDGKTHWGFSAQNLTPLFPAMVVGSVTAVAADGSPQVASLDTTAILAQAVAQIQDLMRRLAALEAR